MPLGTSRICRCRRFDGQVAVITGATGGIGSAVARRLAGEGARVVVSGRRYNILQELCVELGSNSLAVPADVTDERSVERLFSTVRKEVGRIDVLVVNAGIYEHRPFEEMVVKDWNRMIQANLTSAYLCTRAALRVLKRPAAIVMIASASGVRPASVGRAHYGAAKSGVVGLMRALSIELAPRRIRVNAIAPTLVRDTAMGDAERARRGRAAVRGIPLGRLATPDDVAAAVTFLASEDASYITGIVLILSGGVFG